MAHAVLKMENMVLPALYAVNVPVSTAMDNNYLFSLFGWDDLPYELKNVIAADLAGYRDELLGLYSTRDKGVLLRRKRVAYWVKLFKNGDCSLDTICEVLKPCC